MSKLLYLSSEDFTVIQGPNGPVLSNRVKGISIVLFYSKKCVHCHSFIPIFKRIPSSVSGVSFGMVNVSQNIELVKMAEQTILPIKYVPLIVVYVNGKPFIKYKGSNTEQGIKNFLSEITQKLNNKQYFSQQQREMKTEKKENSIPDYCIARPKCNSEGVCYLSFDKAYK